MDSSIREFAQRVFHEGVETLPEPEQRVIKHFVRRHHVGRNTNLKFAGDQSMGQRIADRVAALGGSWTFIIIFIGILLAWISVNSFVLARQSDAFDPYPFVLLISSFPWSRRYRRRSS